MKTWDDVTREELVQELCPGVITTNTDLINQLNWIEYLRHIRDMIDMGMTDDPFITREHVQDVVVDIFMTLTRLVEERGAEPEEIREYILTPYAQKTINSLTEIALHHTSETWPEFEKQMREELNIPEE